MICSYLDELVGVEYVGYLIFVAFDGAESTGYFLFVAFDSG